MTSPLLRLPPKGRTLRTRRGRCASKEGQIVMLNVIVGTATSTDETERRQLLETVGAAEVYLYPWNHSPPATRRCVRPSRTAPPLEPSARRPARPAPWCSCRKARSPEAMWVDSTARTTTGFGVQRPRIAGLSRANRPKGWETTSVGSTTPYISSRTWCSTSPEPDGHGAFRKGVHRACAAGADPLGKPGSALGQQS